MTTTITFALFACDTTDSTEDMDADETSITSNTTQYAERVKFDRLDVTTGDKKAPKDRVAKRDADHKGRKVDKVLVHASDSDALFVVELPVRARPLCRTFYVAHILDTRGTMVYGCS